MPEYTTTEIAALCKVSERTIQRWMKEGRLPAQELKRNLFHVTDEDITKVQPRGIAPPENERIALLEHRVSELEDRLGMIEHLYSLEHKATPRPLQAQIQAVKVEGLLPGEVLLSTLIEQYHIDSAERRRIIRALENTEGVVLHRRNIGGYPPKIVLDQKGQAEFMRRYVTQA